MPVEARDTATVNSKTENGVMTIRLNRPQALNSLTFSMIRQLRKAFDHAGTSDTVKMVLLTGTGDKAFCAGGDIKAVAAAVKEGRMDEAMKFFREEYDLDLLIHQFPKPVIAIAHGITMGGGLGLCAGADVVIATETTRMAMPETRIGFFPDVGATGWMFNKCPEGYPEYLGLTGYEIKREETVRLGFATHCLQTDHLGKALSHLKKSAAGLKPNKEQNLIELNNILSPFSATGISIKPGMDEWVKTYFSGKTTITAILSDLSQCILENDLCEGVFHRLSERSPAATVLTLKLLRYNQGTSMADVFKTETKAAEFILAYPDYLEGVRARLIDKDNTPRWQPETFAEAETLNMDTVFKAPNEK